MAGGAPVASGSVLLTPKFDNLTGSLKSQLSGLSGVSNKIGQSSGGGFSTGFALKLGVISSLASTVFTKVGQSISSSMSAAVSRTDTLNQFPKVMQSIGFCGEEATAAINKLSDGIQGLPTNLDEVASSAQSIALLTGDMGMATDTALALNDAFLSSGSSSANAARGLQQYTQMLAKGKPDAQAWYTIQETMGSALTKVASKLGYTSTVVGGDLYTALQNGTLSFNDFNAALVECDQEAGGFADSAAAASSGIETSMTIMQSAVTRNIAKVLDAFADSGVVNSFAQDFKGAVDNLGNALVPVAQKVAEFAAAVEPKFMAFATSAGGAVAAVVIALGAIAPKVGMVVTQIGGLSKLEPVLSGFSVPIAIAVAAIAALAAGFAYLWTTNETFRTSMEQTASQLMATLAPIISQLAVQFQSFAAAVIPVIVSGMAQMAPIVAQIVAVLVQLAAAVLPIVMQTVQAILPVLMQLASAILPIILQVVSALAPVIQQVVTVVNQVVTAVLPIVQAAITVVTGLINALLPVILAIVTTVASVITGVISFIASVISAVSGAVSSIAGFIGSIIGTVAGLVGTVGGHLSSIAGKVSSVISSVVSTVSSGVGRVVSFVGQIPSKIMGFFSNAGSLLVNAGSSIINGLLDGLKSAIGGVYSFVSGIAGTIASLKGPLSYDRVLLIPAGKAIVEGLHKGLADNIGTVYDMVGGIAGNIADEIGGVSATAEIRAKASTSVASARAAAIDAVGGAGGSTIVQNFNNKIVRSDADLYTAATIINRSALRAAGA